MVDRVTERTDGVTAERVTETNGGGGGTTTIIERSSGGGGFGILIGFAILILVVVGAVYLLNDSRNEAVKTDAITEAADAVGDSAKKIGDSAEKAVNKLDGGEAPKQ